MSEFFSYTQINNLETLILYYNTSSLHTQIKMQKYFKYRADRFNQLKFENLQHILNFQEVKTLHVLNYQFRHIFAYKDAAFLYLVKNLTIPNIILLRSCRNLKQFKMLIENKELSLKMKSADQHSLYYMFYDEEIIKYLCAKGLDIYENFQDLIETNNIRFVMEKIEIEKISEENLVMLLKSLGQEEEYEKRKIKKIFDNNSDNNFSNKFSSNNSFNKISSNISSNKILLKNILTEKLVLIRDILHQHNYFSLDYIHDLYKIIDLYSLNIFFPHYLQDHLTREIFAEYFSKYYQAIEIDYFLEICQLYGLEKIENFHENILNFYLEENRVVLPRIIKKLRNLNYKYMGEIKEKLRKELEKKLEEEGEREIYHLILNKREDKNLIQYIKREKYKLGFIIIAYFQCG